MDASTFRHFCLAINLVIRKGEDNISKIAPKQAIFDFNVGYIGTIFLAICFLMLGALVMHKSGESFSDSGGVFAKQLIELYTINLGDYAYIFIAIAAFTTMFSTTITTLDASPRTMTRAHHLLFEKTSKLSYWFWMILLGLGTYIILRFLRIIWDLW